MDSEEAELHITPLDTPATSMAWNPPHAAAGE